MGLLDIGGNGGGGLYGDVLTPAQQQGLSQRGLLGFLQGMAPYLGYSRLPQSTAQALAAGAGGMGAAQDSAALNALKGQELGLKGMELKARLGLYNQQANDQAPPMFAGGAAPAPQAAGSGQPAPANGQPAAPDDAANLVKKYESGGGNYNVGFGGTDLSKAPLDANGFPIWEGKMGPQGVTHAAGAYQFEPATWAKYAGPLGIHDFSKESQDAVFRAAYLDQGFAPWAPFNPKLAKAISRDGMTAQVPASAEPAPVRLAANGPIPPGLLAGAGSQPTSPDAPLSAQEAAAASYRATHPGSSLGLPPIPGAAPPGIGGLLGPGASQTPAPPSGAPAPSAAPAGGPPAPQALLPTPSAAPGNAIPPVMQPGPGPGAPSPGQAPAQQPMVPGGAMQPPPGGQLNPAYIQWAQRQSRTLPLLGIPVPEYIQKAAGLPLVGPTALAQGMAEQQALRTGPQYDPALQGQIEAAKYSAHVGPETAINAAKQANVLAREQQMAGTNAGYNFHPGVDPNTGLPGYVNSLGQPLTAPGNKPIVSENPFKASQDAEIKAQNDKAADARKLRQTMDEFVAQYNNVSDPGYRQDELQAMRKVAQQLFTITGNPVPDSLAKTTSAAEAANYISQQLIAAASKEMSPRAAQQLVNMIARVKPSIEITPQGIANMKNIIYAMTQEPIERGQFTSQYYAPGSPGVLRRDAQDAFNQSHPIGVYSAMAEGRIPAKALLYLRDNPKLAPQFDAKYGPGSAASVLGR